MQNSDRILELFESIVVILIDIMHISDAYSDVILLLEQSLILTREPTLTLELELDVRIRFKLLIVTPFTVK